MTTGRQIAEASMFYRISVKDKKATSIAPEEIDSVTANLKEDDTAKDIAIPQSTDSSSTKTTEAAATAGAGAADLSVGQSWRVSEEEFIIKVDASPVHMSAAQRMFGGKKRLEQQPVPTKAVPVKDGEFTVKVDTSPVHMSAAQRMFGGKKAPAENTTIIATIDETPLEKDDEGSTEGHKEWSKFWNKMFDIYTQKLS